MRSAINLLGNQAFFSRQGGQRSHIVETEFLHEVGPVFFSGLDTDTEKVCNLLVLVTFIMKEVCFETDNAILRFFSDDVVKRLPYYESTLGTTEATTLRDLLSRSDQSIEIPTRHYQFAYFALYLIERSKGVVYCKACNRYYEAKELKRVVVGHGENPVSVNVKGKGWLRKLFGKRQRLPLFGGKGFACPEGHELVGVVTWRT